MKNLVSIFAGHDANISFYNAKEDKYYTIEIERLVKKRYFRLHVDNDEQMGGLIHHLLLKKFLIQSL